MLKVISGLASAAIVLALALPAAADEKKDSRDKAWKYIAGAQYDYVSNSKDKKYADDNKGRRDRAWKVRAGMQYGYDATPKGKKNDDRAWWKPDNNDFGRGRHKWKHYVRKWKHYVHYHSCSSPAHKFCNNHKNPNRYKNNGFGNGDQDAPGKSKFKNNAENAGGYGAWIRVFPS